MPINNTMLPCMIINVPPGQVGAKYMTFRALESTKGHQLKAFLDEFVEVVEGRTIRIKSVQQQSGCDTPAYFDIKYAFDNLREGKCKVTMTESLTYGFSPIILCPPVACVLCVFYPCLYYSTRGSIVWREQENTKEDRMRGMISRALGAPTLP